MFLLAVVVLLPGFVFGVANPTKTTTVEFVQDSNTYWVDGAQKLMDSECVNASGRLFIVIRYLVEALGGGATWNANARTVAIQCRGHKIILKLDSPTATVDAKGTQIDTDKNIKPFINKGRTLVPLRFAGESLGGLVNWDANNKKATLTFKKIHLQNIIFLHHSCGSNLIEQGGVRGLLSKYSNSKDHPGVNFQFYDHGYNEDGLTLPNGKRAGKNYDVPDDNTNPDGFANIFSQPVTSPPTNCFSKLLSHDVIIFKSCFPVSDIWSEEQLEEYKTHYMTIKQTVLKHPDKVFIIVTQPPLDRKETSQDNAKRARRWATWLTSNEYLKGATNLFTFDWFGLLAESDPKSPNYNCLKERYRLGNGDSHPNETANKETAPKFVEFLVSHAVLYR